MQPVSADAKNNTSTGLPTVATRLLNFITAPFSSGYIFDSTPKYLISLISARNKLQIPEKRIAMLSRLPTNVGITCLHNGVVSPLPARAPWNLPAGWLPATEPNARPEGLYSADDFPRRSLDCLTRVKFAPTLPRKRSSLYE